MNNNKVKIMSMGSNEINIDGNVVSNTQWEGYSTDGNKINLNFFRDGNTMKLENLSLKDFGIMINNPFIPDDDKTVNIKKCLDPKNKEYKNILNTKKYVSADKTKRNKSSKSDKTKSKKKKRKEKMKN